jgi:hypothetical protein
MRLRTNFFSNLLEGYVRVQGQKWIAR